MATVEATKENFEDLIAKNDTVFVDFWAEWCGPCRMFAPVFEAASEKHPHAVFAKVNTEEQQDLAAAFQIASIPTLMVFREKVLIFSQPGALPGNVFEDLVGKVKALDMAEVHKQVATQESEQTN